MSIRSRNRNLHGEGAEVAFLYGEHPVQVLETHPQEEVATIKWNWDGTIEKVPLSHLQRVHGRRRRRRYDPVAAQDGQQPSSSSSRRRQFSRISSGDDDAGGHNPPSPYAIRREGKNSDDNDNGYGDYEQQDDDFPRWHQRRHQKRSSRERLGIREKKKSSSVQGRHGEYHHSNNRSDQVKRTTTNNDDRNHRNKDEEEKGEIQVIDYDALLHRPVIVEKRRDPSRNSFDIATLLTVNHAHGTAHIRWEWDNKVGTVPLSSITSPFAHDSKANRRRRRQRKPVKSYQESSQDDDDGDDNHDRKLPSTSNASSTSAAGAAPRAGQFGDDSSLGNTKLPVRKKIRALNSGTSQEINSSSKNSIRFRVVKVWKGHNSNGVSSQTRPTTRTQDASATTGSKKMRNPRTMASTQHPATTDRDGDDDEYFPGDKDSDSDEEDEEQFYDSPEMEKEYDDFQPHVDDRDDESDEHAEEEEYSTRDQRVGEGDNDFALNPSYNLEPRRRVARHEEEEEELDSKLPARSEDNSEYDEEDDSSTIPISSSSEDEVDDEGKEDTIEDDDDFFIDLYVRQNASQASVAMEEIDDTCHYCSNKFFFRNASAGVSQGRNNDKKKKKIPKRAPIKAKLCNHHICADCLGNLKWQQTRKNKKVTYVACPMGCDSGRRTAFNVRSIKVDWDHCQMIWDTHIAKIKRERQERERLRMEGRRQLEARRAERFRAGQEAGRRDALAIIHQLNEILNEQDGKEEQKQGHNKDEHNSSM